MTVVVEVIQCTEAREFLGYLRRSHPKWLDDRDSESYWVFRGCKDDGFELLPSAFRHGIESHVVFGAIERSKEIPGYVGEFLQYETPKYKVDSDIEERLNRIAIQAVFERRIIESFAHLLNDMGYPVRGGLVKPLESCEIAMRALRKAGEATQRKDAE